MTAARVLRLDLLPGRLAVYRLDASAPVPGGAEGGPLFSATRTDAELSIVCSEDHAPAGGRVERGWRCLRVAGPLDLSMTGVLASLAVPLAAKGVSLFALSTFETDYVLVKETQIEAARAALTEAGHVVAA